VGVITLFSTPVLGTVNLIPGVLDALESFKNPIKTDGYAAFKPAQGAPWRN
jgi:hypothetical protein